MPDQLPLFGLTVPPRPRLHGESSSLVPFAVGTAWYVYRAVPAGQNAAGEAELARGWAGDHEAAWACVENWRAAA